MSVTGGFKTALPDRVPTWPRRACANAWQALATLLRPPRPKEKPIGRGYGKIAGGVLIAVVVLAGVMVFVDAWAAETAKRLPFWLIFTFNELTDFGKSGWFLVPTGFVIMMLAVLASSALPRFTQVLLATIAIRCGFLFVAIAAPSLFTTIVKRLIGRARPFVGQLADPFLYQPFAWRPDYASMPSGHATTACAAAVAVGLVWPRLRAIMWVYALIIALSRVVLVAHYASDVIAGGIVGVVGAFIVRDWFAARRLGFVIGADGSVHALPGPSFGRLKRVARRLHAP